MKRLLDVSAGLLAAILSLPLVMLLAVIVALELRAWPFFVQERVGHRGAPLRVWKLRTLPLDTRRDASKYDLTMVVIPPVCGLLRKLHLDELPQLWLVVVGRMSLVGPRPEMPRLHAKFDPWTQQERTRVRPGCTGLWQISDAAGGLMLENPQYDLAYVRSVSMRLDLWILWRTVGMMLGRPRWVTLADAPLHAEARQVVVLPVDASPAEHRVAM